MGVQHDELSSAQWWREAVVYEVYPRSFADGDGDGVGDFRGLIERLDYLAWLGVDAVWLTPFYPSGDVDGGYDVVDYTAVDPLYGTLEDFDAVVARAHELGLKVIVDWVPNHTSERHPWFLEARSSRDSPRRDWYVWADGADDGQAPPNNWMSAFDGVGSAWTRDPETGQFFLHSFSPQQPDLDWTNPAVREAMRDVMRFWLARGVDGFRIDVAQCLGKDPALGDNPSAITKPTAETAGSRHDEDWDPTVFESLAAIREEANRWPGSLLVGEVYVLDAGRLSEYVAADRLHLAHNFTLIHQPWQASAIRRTVEAVETTHGEAWPAWFLNNHDHSRIVSRVGRDAGERVAERAALLLLTLRGTPFLYQGEELGLVDSLIAPEAVVDLDGRDPVRTPMPWSPPTDDDPGGGFTTGRPWLPLPREARSASVRAQRDDPGSTLHFYRRLLEIRRAHVALRRGSYEALRTPEEVVAFLRRADGETLATAINFAPSPRSLTLSWDLRVERVLISSSDDAARPSRSGEPEVLTLGPGEAVVVELADSCVPANSPTASAIRRF